MIIEGTMGRQGDVLYFQTDDEIDFSKLRKVEAAEDGLTVVEGEATHHHHMFRDISKVDLYEDLETQIEGIQTFIAVVKEPVELEHYHVKDKKLTEEHGTHILDPGTYRMRSQRQWSLDDYIMPAYD